MRGGVKIGSTSPRWWIERMPRECPRELRGIPFAGEPVSLPVFGESLVLAIATVILAAVIMAVIIF